MAGIVTGRGRELFQRIDGRAEEERLPNLATRVQIRVRLSSSLSNDTPAINFRDVNLVGYLNKTTGAYLTRENELTLV